jgi:hypothetical protein
MSAPAAIDPAALIQPALDAVSSGISGVAGPALIVGAGVLALGVAWKVAKKFVRS